MVSDNIVLRKSINIIFQRFHSLMKVVVLCSQIFDLFIQIVNVWTAYIIQMMEFINQFIEYDSWRWLGVKVQFHILPLEKNICK